MTQLTSSKAEWRQHLRAERRDFVAANDVQALSVQLAGVVIPHIAASKNIGSYFAVGDEIDPSFITRSQQKYATIALPRAISKATPLAFHAVTGSDILQPGYGNIPAPDGSFPNANPDILLVPLVGVDRNGFRLGQGQGHYDATLKSLRARGKIYVIGLAYECQLVDALPCEPHDEKLDALATPERFLPFS
jgi:5-formyltetrahydrofolate cyclo-ligase